MTEHTIAVDTIITCEQIKARVIQPFTIQVKQTKSKDAYIAMSEICTEYAFGLTEEEALQNCLESLPEELDWYEQYKESLPQGLVDDWRELQQYVVLVEPEQEGKQP